MAKEKRAFEVIAEMTVSVTTTVMAASATEAVKLARQRKNLAVTSADGWTIRYEGAVRSARVPKGDGR